MGMGYLANNTERNAVWQSNNSEMTTAWILKQFEHIRKNV